MFDFIPAPVAAAIAIIAMVWIAFQGFSLTSKDGDSKKSSDKTSSTTTTETKGKE